jgi:hypothetical protein
VADLIIEARDRWLAATPAERAALGPIAIATCGTALEILVQRLVGLGYPIDDPLRPCPTLDDELAAFDDEGIELPPALVAVWREIGSISLVDLGRYRHVGFWDAVMASWRSAGGDAGDRRYDPGCDGLVIDGPSDDGWVDHILDSLDAMAEEDLPPAIEIAPDDLHKDNVSGGDPYAVLIPGLDDDPWLAPLDGFGWRTPRPRSAPPDPPDLVSYLRTAVLECGGFPGLYGHPAFEPILGQLTADLPVF